MLAKVTRDTLCTGTMHFSFYKSIKNQYKNTQSQKNRHHEALLTISLLVVQSKIDKELNMDATMGVAVEGCLVFPFPLPRRRFSPSPWGQTATKDGKFWVRYVFALKRKWDGLLRLFWTKSTRNPVFLLCVYFCASVKNCDHPIQKHTIRKEESRFGCLQMISDVV